MDLSSTLLINRQHPKLIITVKTEKSNISRRSIRMRTTLTIAVALCVLVFGSFFISGCSQSAGIPTTPTSNQNVRADGEGASGTTGPSPDGQTPSQEGRARQRFNNSTNQTREPRQIMSEEMQKLFQEACQDKSEDDSCTVSSDRGDMKGTCRLSENNILSCRPEWDGTQQRTGAPQGEAVPAEQTS